MYTLAFLAALSDGNSIKSAVPLKDLRIANKNPASLAPPMDYCENFEKRLAFYNDYRSALRKSLISAKVGQKLTFEVVEQADATDTTLRYTETWLLKSIDRTTGAVKVDALRTMADGSQSTEAIDWQVKIGDAVGSAKNQENCSHPYMYAYTFAYGQGKLQKKALPVLIRDQFEIGNIRLKQTISPKVPLGLFKEHMEVINRQTGKVSTRDLSLVSYTENKLEVH